MSIKKPGKQFQYVKPRDEVLHEMKIKYEYLKLVLIDEISMIGNETFEQLNLALQHIKGNNLPFGGISLLVIGDFLQLPPVKQLGVFIHTRKGTYKAFNGSLWQELFKLHELVEIVRQSSDPEFAQMLNRIREGEQTDDDLKQLNDLEHTDTSSWPNEFVKLYL